MHPPSPREMMLATGLMCKLCVQINAHAVISYCIKTAPMSDKFQLQRVFKSFFLNKNTLIYICFTVGYLSNNKVSLGVDSLLS